MPFRLPIVRVRQRPLGHRQARAPIRRLRLVFFQRQTSQFQIAGANLLQRPNRFLLDVGQSRGCFLTFGIGLGDFGLETLSLADLPVPLPPRRFEPDLGLLLVRQGRFQAETFLPHGFSLGIDLAPRGIDLAFQLLDAFVEGFDLSFQSD